MRLTAWRRAHSLQVVRLGAGVGVEAFLWPHDQRTPWWTKCLAAAFLAVCCCSQWIGAQHRIVGRGYAWSGCSPGLRVRRVRDRPRSTCTQDSWVSRAGRRPRLRDHRSSGPVGRRARYQGRADEPHLAGCDCHGKHAPGSHGGGPQGARPVSGVAGDRVRSRLSPAWRLDRPSSRCDEAASRRATNAGIRRARGHQSSCGCHAPRWPISGCAAGAGSSLRLSRRDPDGAWRDWEDHSCSEDRPPRPR